MKKNIIIILTILLASFAFTLNVDQVESYYTTFIEEYNNNNREGELSEFFVQIDNLGLYRFYRNMMVGTAEYTDRPSDVQRYLTEIYNQLEYENAEEQIAYAGFMAYVQSKISSDSLSREMIRSLPAYYTSIQEYQSNVENEVLTYIGNVIGYSLGVLEESPYKNIERFDFNGEIENRDFYVYQGGSNSEYNQIIEENKEEILTQIEEIANSNLTGFELELAIDDISYQYIDSISSLVQEQIAQSLAMFIEKAETTFNPNFIRLLVYLALIILFALFLKNLLKYLLIAIYIFELIFLIFIYNPIQDPVTSFIYGAFVIVAISIFFLTSVLNAFGRDVHIFERFKNIAIFVSVIVIITIPAYSIIDLKMDNNTQFNDSIFEDQLLKDTVTYSHTSIQRTIGTLKSNLGLEFSSMRSLYGTEINNFLKNSINANVYDHVYADSTESIDIAINSDGLKFSNTESYINNAQNLSKSIDDIMSSAEVRKSRILGALDELESNIESILLYSDDEFKNIVINTLTSQFNSSDLLEDIEIQSYFDIQPLKTIDLRVYNTVHGTIYLIVFMFSLLLFLIFEDKLFKIITTVGMLIASIMAFITPSNMTVLSQVNYPPLVTNDYSVNIIIGILMLFITFIIQIKKEKKISVD
ncbi:hypothetical protein [Geotoga petraea]|uniref:Uncharacterized protein n=1 Tax=Geotoga petraea TaxID=28234 RepID=A0A1G6IJ51_9BACT|nr:hypothetical protein [Geotoga petraea]TGG89219.1 hypothetical protein E4650_03260 [Geotoga petraea]SDC06547.1 hypothetical protein SAMN04488588_0398 [Geotoga petraea]